MVQQWAKCVEKNLRNIQGMQDISVYIDVWSSLNGRFQQRMYDPNVNLLKTNWSVFEQPSWVLPLLLELSNWRTTMQEIEKRVLSWSNDTEVLFVADFPGLSYK
jgi:vitamin K-dependent gamma-carboxylase